MGVWTTHYCHAHTVCGGWKGMNVHDIQRILNMFTFSFRSSVFATGQKSYMTVLLSMTSFM